jgi:DNA-binding response OmpR family regulator
MSARILVIEDDPRIRRIIDRGLRLAGHLPTMATDLAAGRAQWMPQAFDLVVLDVMLPDGNGLSLLAERRVAGDETPVLLLSAREESELHQRAVAAGAEGYLAKPFAYQDLLDRVDTLRRSR